MNNFQVGDKVCKKYADTTIYTIVSIQTVPDFKQQMVHTNSALMLQC